jgi:acyl-CoA synthetase (NDP forming)
MILSNIVAGGFPGKIYPVNRKEQSIFGIPAYRHIEEVPGHVDLAIITTPAESVPGVLEGCGRKGVKGVVVITSGFSETDKAGRELEGVLCPFAARETFSSWPQHHGDYLVHADLSHGRQAGERFRRLHFQSENLGSN